MKKPTLKFGDVEWVPFSYDIDWGAAQEHAEMAHMDPSECEFAIIRATGEVVGVRKVTHAAKPR